MKVQVADEALAEALAAIGSPDGRAEDGVVFRPGPVASWVDAEDQLVEAYRLAHVAAQEDAPVVFVVDAAAAVGRSGPLESAVAVGLVAGGRCLAFEGLRRDQYATVVGWDADEPATRVAATVEQLLGSRAARGQTVMVGTAHLGALLP
ncbi:hypothetical protein [Nocardioides sp. J54]|uniref:hypothetical protein n=1 Tax=Nocardioides sp. J54 TaxID=935866 RepID=UPI00048BE5CF|nr:hypothetical protein [Nocardioides sp. J54]